MSGPVLKALGGLLEGLLSLPTKLFGGGSMGGLLDGLFGGGQRRPTRTPGSQSKGGVEWTDPGFSAFPPPAKRFVQRKQKQAPSAPHRVARTLTKGRKT